MASTKKEQILKSFAHWQRNPLDWFKDRYSDVLRAKKLSLTKQQEEFFVELGKLVRAKFKVRAIQRGTFNGEWEGLEEYSKKIGISIMAGKGVGKDFVTALAVLWMLDCFDKAKVPCTGANAKHLRNVLWAEISNVAGMANVIDPKDPMSKTMLQNPFNFGVERIELKENPSNHFAEALTINRNSTKEEQALTIQGRHAQFMMFVVDEACSTPDVVFPKIEETLTDPINFCIMIFNPDRTRGYAIDSHYDKIEKEKWIRFRWNAEESERVTKEHIENIAKAGKDSRAYRVGVLGLPPHVDSNTLIVPDWVYESVGREMYYGPQDPVLAGIDVGGGGDKSVIAIRQGPVFKEFLYNNDKDLMSVADWVCTVLAMYDVRCGFVDIIGLGRGVYDRLQQMGVNVRPVDSRNKARQEEKYYNRRSECYMALRDMFQTGVVSLPLDSPDDLKEELASIIYEPEKKCKIALKQDLRKVLGRSPDTADACALSVAYNDEIFRKPKYQMNTKLDYGKARFGII